MKKFLSILIFLIGMAGGISLFIPQIDEGPSCPQVVDRELEYTQIVAIPSIVRETSEEVKEVETNVGDYGDNIIDNSDSARSEQQEEEIIEETTEYIEPTVVAFSDEDLFVFMRCVYLENGMNSEYCAYLTACVILNRYYDYGYESLSDVVFANGQFSVAGQIYDDNFINDLTRSACEHALAETDRNPHSFHMGYWEGEEEYGVYEIVDGEHFICGWY